MNGVFVRNGCPTISSLKDLVNGIPFILFLHHGCKYKPLPKYNAKKTGPMGVDTNAMVQKNNHSIAMTMYDEIVEKAGQTGMKMRKRMVKPMNLANMEDSRMMSPVMGACYMMIGYAGTCGFQGNGTVEELLLKWYQGCVDPYGMGGRPKNWKSDMRNAEIWNALHHSCTEDNPANWDRWALQSSCDADNLNQTFAAFEKDMGVEQLFSGEDVMDQTADKEMFVTYVSSIRIAARQKMQLNYSRRARAFIEICATGIEQFASDANCAEAKAYNHIMHLKKIDGNFEEVEYKDLAYLFHEIKLDTPAWTCDPNILPPSLEKVFFEYRTAKDKYWAKTAAGLNQGLDAADGDCDEKTGS